MPVLADRESSRALLIGCGEYRSLHDLPAVSRGVRALRAALTDVRLWGFRASAVSR